MPSPAPARWASALSPCTILPAAGKPTFELADGEMEIGMGIHGEPGVRRGPLETADEVADDLLGAIVDRPAASAAATASRSSSTASARRRSRSCTSSTAASTRAWPALGVEVHRPYIGEYATSASRWPARR